MIARFAEYHTDFRALVMFFVYENASYAGTAPPQRGAQSPPPPLRIL
jgi:hypothetical protein